MFLDFQVRPPMVPNTKPPTDVKVKIYALAVIRVKPSKWFEPIMEDFPLLSATKMVTRTGALIACPIPPPEYCRGSKLTCLPRPNDAFGTIFLINATNHFLMKEKNIFSFWYRFVVQIRIKYMCITRLPQLIRLWTPTLSAGKS